MVAYMPSTIILTLGPLAGLVSQAPATMWVALSL